MTRHKLLFIALLLLVQLPLFATGYIVAVGGGSENQGGWSDAPYRRIVQYAGYGKVVILSVNAEDEWLPNYFKFLGASAAVNLRIQSKSVADQQATYDAIISAQAVFIKGGDQWNYVNYWKNTKTAAALQAVFARGGVLSGTSAGAMVLGEIVFTAANGSIDTKDALKNPFVSRIAIDDNVFNLLPGVLFDTHFIERARFGRLPVFMQKYYFTSGRNILGIGIDDATAVCIDTLGIAEVFGTGAVSFFYTKSPNTYQRSGNQFTINNLQCDQLTQGWKFSIPERKVVQVPASARQVDTLRPLRFPSTTILLSGTNDIPANQQFALPMFTPMVSGQKVALLYNSGYQSAANSLSAYFSSQGIQSVFIPLSAGALHATSLADSLSSAGAACILGDTLNVIAQLRDSTTALGGVFRQKTRNGFPLMMLGNAGKLAGSVYMGKVDENALTAYRGLMTIEQGLHLFGDFAFQPLWLQESSFYENRTASLLYSMMASRSRFGIWLDQGDAAVIDPATKRIRTVGSLPMFLLDASSVTFVDSSSQAVGSGYKPRQCAAFVGLRLTVSSLSREYDFLTRGVVTSLNEVESVASMRKSASLACYPNPFNAGTNIRVEIAKPGDYTIRVWNVLGEQVAQIFAGFLSPGVYSYVVSSQYFSASSGVYFVSVFSGEGSVTQKIIQMK